MSGPTRRPPRPEDILDFRIATDPRLAVDGRVAWFTLQTANRRRDGYRDAIWAMASDGSGSPRRLTNGAAHDRHPRPSPDGTTLAFLSDRRALLEDEPDAPERREDTTQIHLLPLGGGEAQRLTDLPRGIDGFAWSPDGRWIAAISSSLGSSREEDRRLRRLAADEGKASPLRSDYRYIDRLGYMLNGAGFTYDRVPHLWLVDALTGSARRLTSGATGDADPAWAPDGSRIAFVSNRRRDRDLVEHADIYVIDIESMQVRAITAGGQSVFGAPVWLPDGSAIAALGHRFPARAGSRFDVWLLAADGSDAKADGGTNLSARHDLMPASAVISDVTVVEQPRLTVSADGAWLSFLAPIDGATELWRVATDDGRLERRTHGRWCISSFDSVTASDVERVVVLRSSPEELPDLFVVPDSGDAGAAGGMERITNLNGELLDGLELSTPVDRWLDIDGRSVQGWYLPPISEARPAAAPDLGQRGTGGAPAGNGGRSGAAPLVVQVHGGPHSLYAWAPMWEFQVLAGAGMGVWYSNPRGSQGYGQVFSAANFRDWGDGPTRDVLAGVDALVAEGLADPNRLGLTGGSYGGYLTNWIIGHDDRFAAALTCRSVSDVAMLMHTGDISGPEFGRQEFGVTPWEDAAYYTAISPLTYARAIRTPLLIQHAENDIRTTIGQAEALFTVLRSLGRPVRLMRVPAETHELTRSGTPFRRAENLVQVRDWFAHFLVAGRRRMPPLPADRGGK